MSAPRRFDNFRLPITEESYFVGQENLLGDMRRSPFQVRFLFGGRRTGKSSALRAVERRMLTALTDGPYSAFPVFVDLQLHQPASLGQLRHLLSTQLRAAMRVWGRIRKLGTPSGYERFLQRMIRREMDVVIGVPPISVTLKSPLKQTREIRHDEFFSSLVFQIARLRRKGFRGVCFLLDEADFIVRKDWSSDSWSYFRGLKENTTLRSSFGLLLSGFRTVRDFQQKKASPLYNIAAPAEWMSPLQESEIRSLIVTRCEDEGVLLSAKDRATTIEWGGGHRYLTQQVLNVILDARLTRSSITTDDLMIDLLRSLSRDFAGLWNVEQRPDGFGDVERELYNDLVECRAATKMKLTRSSVRSPTQIEGALEILVGAGVVQKADDGEYRVGARLFEEWVRRSR